MDPAQDTNRSQAVAPYVTLYPRLLADAGDIMGDWNRAALHEPWSSLPPGERQNNLAGVIARVIDCALSEAPYATRVSQMIDTALDHGLSRRRQSLDVSVILSEYYILRSITWEHLSALVGAPMSYDAIFIIDNILSVATRASVFGYHQEELELSGLLAAYKQELNHAIHS